MANDMHDHSFNGQTTFNDGHDHGYSGETSVNPNQPGHIHYMDGETTFDDGHRHNFRLSTSPAIYVEGRHYHSYRGNTSLANQHTHGLEGYTSMYK